MQIANQSEKARKTGVFVMIVKESSLFLHKNGAFALKQGAECALIWGVMQFRAA
ncbi:hypothetical protein [uncultured Gilvimarinus sp.]|uniref:hypothetical protein n=1 Tax=uncultured Gilvimarinus sp. TaxID=1689143 RepID=UPI0030EB5665|tara:strand:- start:328 stop:489 length:162 start_codon:yes stop_codon:yes gene_type:complete